MKQLIAANWKMNGAPDWDKKIGSLSAILPDPTCEVLICPPHPLVGALCDAAAGRAIAIGAQDCSEHEAGAHTGETDAALLAALGASYVILGHSERRAGGEGNDRIKAKAHRAIKVGLIPIICVGESFEQREAGQAESIVREQLSQCLPDTGRYDIAYEPIWAIGTGLTATTHDIELIHASIRSYVGDGPRILYGGSVKPGNAADILAVPHVGGALVGGASLKMDDFAQIARASTSG